MALKQSAIEGLTIELPVPLPALGGDLIIGYYPAAIRGAVLTRLRREPTAFLAEVLAHWDLLQDDGTPVPIRADTLKALPWVLLWPLWHAITEDFVERFPAVPITEDRPSIGTALRHLLDDVDWGEGDA